MLDRTERWSGSDHLNDSMRTDRFRSLLGAISVVGSIEEMDVTNRRPAG
jgi:hypothetical protein